MSYLNQLSSYLEKSKDEQKQSKISKNDVLKDKTPLNTLSNLNNSNHNIHNNDSLLLSNLNYEKPTKTKSNNLKDSTSSYLNDTIIYNKKTYEKIVQDCLNFDNVDLKSVNYIN